MYVEAAPTALANIKWRYYIVFICLTLVNVIVFYFWCPEVSRPCHVHDWSWQLLTPFLSLQTKGLSLEEINALFGDEVVVHFADATESQRHELAAKVLAEEEKREYVATKGGDESASTSAAGKV